MDTTTPWLLQMQPPQQQQQQLLQRFSSYFPSAGDVYIFKFLSFFSMPPVYYKRCNRSLVCTRLRRNWTLLCLCIYTACAIVLFIRVQIRHLFVSKRLLSIFSDTLRTMSMAYAYPTLMAIAIRNRQQYADYFNFLYQLDGNICAHFKRWPDCLAPRRKFWLQIGMWLANHMLVAWPLEMFFWHGQRLEFYFFLAADAIAAIGIGVTTFFLEFAVHSCQVRYACLCACLREALETSDSRGSDDVRTSIVMLSELDTAKELLNASGFSTLLTVKLIIDGVTVITSLHFAIYKLLNNSALDKLHTFFTYVFFQFPYIIADVLMVQHYQALGDQVRKLSIRVNNCQVN